MEIIKMKLFTITIASYKLNLGVLRTRELRAIHDFKGLPMIKGLTGVIRVFDNYNI